MGKDTTGCHDDENHGQVSILVRRACSTILTGCQGRSGSNNCPGCVPGYVLCRYIHHIGLSRGNRLHPEFCDYAQIQIPANLVFEYTVRLFGSRGRLAGHILYCSSETPYRNQSTDWRAWYCRDTCSRRGDIYLQLLSGRCQWHLALFSNLCYQHNESEKSATHDPGYHSHNFC